MECGSTKHIWLKFEGDIHGLFGYLSIRLRLLSLGTQPSLAGLGWLPSFSL